MSGVSDLGCKCCIVLAPTHLSLQEPGCFYYHFGRNSASASQSILVCMPIVPLFCLLGLYGFTLWKMSLHVSILQPYSKRTKHWWLQKGLSKGGDFCVANSLSIHKELQDLCYVQPTRLIWWSLVAVNYTDLGYFWQRGPNHPGFGCRPWTCLRVIRKPLFFIGCNLSGLSDSWTLKRPLKHCLQLFERFIFSL